MGDSQSPPQRARELIQRSIHKIRLRNSQPYFYSLSSFLSYADFMLTLVSD